jgi:hypothetical protein
MTASTPATGYPLAPSMPGAWKPLEIVYTRYTLTDEDGVRGDPRSYVICRTDIEAFVKERSAGVALPPWTLIRERGLQDPHSDPSRPIDIYLGCPCYVVIELDPNLPWHFKKGMPGIEKKISGGPLDGDLKHVLRDGRIVGANGPTEDGCRILFFSVEQRGPFEHAGFICNIDFDLMALRGPEPEPFVDPDIPNNGGKFPLFPRSPCQVA